MGKSLRLTISVLGLVCLIYCGFQWGVVQGRRNRNPLPPSALMSNIDMAFDGSGRAIDPNAKPEEVFEEALDKIQHEFVDRANIDSAHLSEAAMFRMVYALGDPRSRFLPANLRLARHSSLAGIYDGISAVLHINRAPGNKKETRNIVVVNVVPQSPAEKSGLKPGDTIVQVDSCRIVERDALEGDRIEQPMPLVEDKNAIKQISVQKALTLLTTNTVRQIKVQVQRAGQIEPLEFEISTKRIRVKPAQFRMLAKGIGYLRVRVFGQEATSSFTKSLQSMQPYLKGLILDLRGNSGGVTTLNREDVDGFRSARKLLAALTRGGTIAYIERKANQREPVIIQGATRTIPILVLTDESVANLGEMVAHALRDMTDAKIMGTQTYGDNVLALYVPLKSGAGIELTMAKLYTAKGESLQSRLTPDYLVLPDSQETETLMPLAINKISTQMRIASAKTR